MMMTPLRILYLAPRIPKRPFDGGAHSIFHQLRQLRQAGHHVTLGVTNTSRHRATEADAADLCDTLISVDVDTSIKPFGALCALMCRGEPVATTLPVCPYNLRRFISGKLLHQLVQEMQAGAPYDVIHVDYLTMAWYALALRAHHPEVTVPILLRTHNVEYRILEHNGLDPNRSSAGRWYYRLLAEQTRIYEEAVARQVDLVATVSPLDAEVYARMAPATPIRSITPGMDVPDLSTIPARADGPPRIGMLGSLEWTPNVEGALWFVREVLPKIHRHRPDVELHLAGRAPVPEVMALHDGRHVFVHGPVDDGTAFLSTLDVDLAPVLSGSGIRIKVLEGLAHARPMVSTTLGAEGLNVVDGQHLLLADGPDAFAEACLRLLDNTELARSLAQRGRGLVEQEYSWAAATQRLLEAYSSIAFNR